MLANRERVPSLRWTRKRRVPRQRSHPDAHRIVRDFWPSAGYLRRLKRIGRASSKSRRPCNGKRFMWSQNAFTHRLNLKWPILQAPMGSISTPALAAAVSNAGGLGALGMWGFSAEEAERRIAGFQQLSGGSLNVNYPLWPEPRITPDVSEPMQARREAHFDAKGLGAVPKPKGGA